MLVKIDEATTINLERVLAIFENHEDTSLVFLFSDLTDGWELGRICLSNSRIGLQKRIKCGVWLSDWHILQKSAMSTNCRT